MRFQAASMVRSSALCSSAFILVKTCSIGFKSGE